MRALMIFLDGIGLGPYDPVTNPFAVANTPTLNSLANGHRWLANTGRQVSERAVFLPADPCMGVPGRPQSGTGQASIFTGRNVPQLLGKHYGPKPDKATRALLARDNLFKQVVSRGKNAALLEAYPASWHQAIDSGRRLRSSYQLAAHEAGIRIPNQEDLLRGDALPVDWTGEHWPRNQGRETLPRRHPHDAGVHLARLAQRHTFSLFAHWPSDIIGHRGTLDEAISLLERFDDVMTGVLEAWDDSQGMVVICSDHGNMEHIGDRRHTLNDVPVVVIGKGRECFDEDFHSLADIAPRIQDVLFAPATTQGRASAKEADRR
ncbi:MAG: hypothetical protein OXH77_08805 [Anaerolineaceae bacterium]|nr:hypothetical protein [Anaerolineaceae bacterium]